MHINFTGPGTNESPTLLVLGRVTHPLYWTWDPLYWFPIIFHWFSKTNGPPVKEMDVRQMKGKVLRFGQIQSHQARTNPQLHQARTNLFIPGKDKTTPQSHQARANPQRQTGRQIQGGQSQCCGQTQRNKQPRPAQQITASAVHRQRPLEQFARTMGKRGRHVTQSKTVLAACWESAQGTVLGAQACK